MAYPTRICRGKNPISEPNLSAPRRKNVKPARVSGGRCTTTCPDDRLTSQNGREGKCDHRGSDHNARFVLANIFCYLVCDEMEEGLKSDDVRRR